MQKSYALIGDIQGIFENTKIKLYVYETRPKIHLLNV